MVLIAVVLHVHSSTPQSAAVRHHQDQNISFATHWPASCGTTDKHRQHSVHVCVLPYAYAYCSVSVCQVSQMRVQAVT